jgi:hypothetical protein
MVARVQADERPDDPDETIARLTEELARVRAELAEVRRTQEGWADKLAKVRAARRRAERTANLLSSTLATRLRVEASRRGTARRLLSRMQQGVPTPEEAEQLEVLRSSPLFDPAWYLRSYHDVVRSGEEPGLHFLRHAVSPFRSPSAEFDTARYVEDHPEVLDERVNPLVHFLLSPEGQGATSYTPED